MPFRPVSERHAIAKVFFILKIAPSFTEIDLDKIRSSHHEWRDLLPAADKIPTVVISFVPDGKPTPPLPVSFSRLKPDGSLELRLFVDDDSIIVDCRHYSSWKLVWKNSYELFKKVADILQNKNQKIISCGLQYTDEFVWFDNDRIELSELLDPTCEFIPPKLYDYGNRGNLWHLHQGWFKNVEAPISGKTLERMHVSSISSNSSYIVRFENLNRYDMNINTSIPLRTAFLEDAQDINQVFEDLHSMNKNLLNQFLNDSMSKEIGLTTD